MSFLSVSLVPWAEKLANVPASLIIVSIYCLAIAHPGPIFKDAPAALKMGEETLEPKSLT